MAVNHPTRNELDAILKKVLTDPRVALDNVAVYRAFLYSLGADTAAVKAALVSEFTYTTQEASDHVDAINALYQLRLVADAGATVAVVDDFFFNAKKVWGINIRR